MKKRAYRSTSVKSVKMCEVLKALPDGLVWIGLDIAKAEALAGLIKRSQNKLDIEFAPIVIRCAFECWRMPYLPAFLRTKSMC